ncbi:hypothetical protein B7494_g6217 [Chlorociboria aeruginascens]|nr:hypothetical protein B7494_g6217 [Chlorociboria aeruginascens]
MLVTACKQLRLQQLSHTKSRTHPRIRERKKKKKKTKTKTKKKESKKKKKKKQTQKRKVGTRTYESDNPAQERGGYFGTNLGFGRSQASKPQRIHVVALRRRITSTATGAEVKPPCPAPWPSLQLGSCPFTVDGALPRRCDTSVSVNVNVSVSHPIAGLPTTRAAEAMRVAAAVVVRAHLRRGVSTLNSQLLLTQLPQDHPRRGHDGQDIGAADLPASDLRKQDEAVVRGLHAKMQRLHDGVTEVIPEASHTNCYNQAALTTSKPIIIYLPATPSHIKSPPPSFLEAFASYPIFQINYRWNHVPSTLTSSPRSTHPALGNHPFPTPIHDTSHAYQWLTSQYLPTQCQTSSLPPALRHQPFIIYGSRLGGTIATSLALTESRSTTSSERVSLIAENPILDWTTIATTPDPLLVSPQPSHTSSHDLSTIFQQPNWDIQTLHTLKTRLFTQPSFCFDNFASPLLFFRTAGVSVPKEWVGTPLRDEAQILADMSKSTLLNRQYLPRSEPAESSSLSSPSSQHGQEEERIKVSRKANLKFPPRDAGLKIPKTLFVSTGHEEGGLKAQVDEMARLMRRSVVLYESRDRGYYVDDGDVHAAAEERVKHRTIEEGDEVKEEEVVGEWLSGDLT